MLNKMQGVIVTISVILGFCFAVAQAGLIDLTGDHDSEGDHDIQHDFGGDFGGHDGFGLHEDSKDDGHTEPKYSFNYAVNDPHTGDVKHHNEERYGGVVKGSYSLKEADGSTRFVEYHADKHNGFNAKVHKIAAEKKYEDEHEPEPEPEHGAYGY